MQDAQSLLQSLPQTISCFSEVKFLSPGHSALLSPLSPLRWQTLLLLLSFSLLSLPISWHLHIEALNCRVERKTISSAYLEKLQSSILFSAHIYVKWIPLSSWYPKAGQRQWRCQARDLGRNTTRNLFPLLTPGPHPWRYWFSRSRVNPRQCSSGNSVRLLPDSALGKYQRAWIAFWRATLGNGF